MKDRAYEIAINPKYDVYQRGLASMVCALFDRKTGSVGSVNKVLAQQLCKPVIKRFKRRNVYAKSIDNIWASDLAEMGLLSSFNRGVKYLLCLIDVFICLG